MNRRRLMALAGGGALTLAMRPLLSRLEGLASAASEPRPRFYLQIIPSGGVDSIYSMDPKAVRDVERGIDVPYAQKDIIDAGTSRLGPSFAPLRKAMSRMAIVNSFRQNSANHHSGLVHTTSCRSVAVPGMPTLLDLLGARRTDEAVGAVMMGTAYPSAFSSKYLGEPTKALFGYNPSLFEHLDQLSAHELGVAAKAMRREGASVARTSPQGSATAGNLLESAAFLEAWSAAPKFAPPAWPIPYETDGWNYQAGRDLERALWMFEHGLTRCATVSIAGTDFDTHVWNRYWQPRLTEYLASLLQRLLQELDRRKVGGRTLADQTAVFVGSEIGRFPRLNANDGKDHFPQVSYMFFGPWFSTGHTYGGTDRQMVARPVSLKTGKPEAGGHSLVVDDIGATLLHLDGANPELFGYTGSRLPFLLRS